MRYKRGIDTIPQHPFDHLSMDIDEIISELEHWNGVFPEKAVVEAIKRREEITPRLLEILKNAAENPQKLLDDNQYWGHIYALSLLAEFRETKACPLIADLFSLDGDTIWELTGDIVTEGLGSILASVCGDELTILQRLVENDGIDEFVRCAAVDALLALVASAEKPRMEIISYFKELFHGKLKKAESVVCTHLVVSCVNLHPGELIEEIGQWYDESLIDEDFLPLEHVEEALETDKETILEWLRRNDSYRLVDDSIDTIKRWLPIEEEG
ncbi:MAG: DUF1186 domain-containing protein [Proteobacteria bacterium]|nr:DUF1186 domain-containing protein [Pseudomonadota bacterium]